MENNQVENQLENQDDLILNNNFSEIDENIVCNIYKEQFDLINELPEQERLKVLYLAVFKAFYDIRKKNQENQLENQDENTYISISIYNSIYNSLSNYSKTLIKLLFKTINCKNYKNWGGKRKGSGRKKESEIQITNPNFNYSDEKTKLFEIYKKECPNLTKITFEDRNNDILGLANRFLEEIRYDFDYYRQLCIKANTLKKIVDKTINFKMLIKNHIGIMNGDYAKKTEIDERTQAILACFRGGNNG